MAPWKLSGMTMAIAGAEVIGDNFPIPIMCPSDARGKSAAAWVIAAEARASVPNTGKAKRNFRALKAQIISPCASLRLLSAIPSRA
jgi:hypothetical protein